MTCNIQASKLLFRMYISHFEFVRCQYSITNSQFWSFVTGELFRSETMCSLQLEYSFSNPCFRSNNCHGMFPHLFHFSNLHGGSKFHGVHIFKHLLRLEQLTFHILFRQFYKSIEQHLQRLHCFPELSKRLCPFHTSTNASPSPVCHDIEQLRPPQYTNKKIINSPNSSMLFDNLFNQIELWLMINNRQRFRLYNSKFNNKPCWNSQWWISQLTPDHPFLKTLDPFNFSKSPCPITPKATKTQRWYFLFDLNIVFAFVTIVMNKSKDCPFIDCRSYKLCNIWRRRNNPCQLAKPNSISIHLVMRRSFHWMKCRLWLFTPEWLSKMSLINHKVWRYIVFQLDWFRLNIFGSSMCLNMQFLKHSLDCPPVQPHKQCRMIDPWFQLCMCWTFHRKSFRRCGIVETPSIIPDLFMNMYIARTKPIKRQLFKILWRRLLLAFLQIIFRK